MLDVILFLSIVLILLALDLNILSKKKEIITFKKSILKSLFYVFIAVLFGLWILYHLGDIAAKNYFTAYLVEKILSLDNIFIISLIFSYLKIPSVLQHRVLFWGILGVIIFRGIMISLGTILVSKYTFILYIFSGFLIITGIKMLILAGKTTSLKDNIILSLTKKYFNIKPELKDESFILYKNNKFYITRLTIALILIETMDLMFAIDSIPAALTITQDTYIIYTSNVLAIMGLRALYFCLAEMVEKFYYLKYSLAIVLVFIGSKIFIKHLIDISAGTSLLITIIIISSGILISIIKPVKN